METLVGNPDRCRIVGSYANSNSTVFFWFSADVIGGEFHKSRSVALLSWYWLFPVVGEFLLCKLCVLIVTSKVKIRMRNLLQVHQTIYLPVTCTFPQAGPSIYQRLPGERQMCVWCVGNFTDVAAKEDVDADLFLLKLSRRVSVCLLLIFRFCALKKDGKNYN